MTNYVWKAFQAGFYGITDYFGLTTAQVRDFRVYRVDNGVDNGVVFGCRRPGTSVGSQNGAYVAGKINGGVVATFYFEEMEGVSLNPTWRKAVYIYNRLTEKPNDPLQLLLTVPWVHMTLDDIKLTSGIGYTDSNVNANDDDASRVNDDADVDDADVNDADVNDADNADISNGC
jgi:hypothetical protein